MEPRNRCQGINSASLFSLAGRYENPIPPQCLAPIDFLKIPAQATKAAEIDSLELMPGLHKRLQIRALYWEKMRGGGHLPRFFPCQPFYYPQLLLAASSCIIYILLAASHFKGPSHELMLTQRETSWPRQILKFFTCCSHLKMWFSLYWQCSGSVTFWYGNGSWSADPVPLTNGSGSGSVPKCQEICLAHCSIRKASIKLNSAVVLI
jgi:hypothetical protein